ncbi:DctQ (C4-dicarboxylate permease, small subunit) [Stappia sp. 22II-S9-Z10]|nr:DctQ (C4-dicarboxylate permease, small subunit) [Stappia sp. 22II-S9-Z10]
MRVLNALYTAGLVLAGACVGVTTLLVLLQVGGRLAGVLIPAVPEIAGFLLGATIFLAMPATMRSGEQIRITLVIDTMGKRLRFVLELLFRIVGAAVALYLAWRLAILAYDSWDFGDRSAGLIGIPVWIPQAAMTVGILLLGVRFLEELAIMVLKGTIITYDIHSPSGS